jgi:hypothetical protein
MRSGRLIVDISKSNSGFQCTNRSADHKEDEEENVLDENEEK